MNPTYRGRLAPSPTGHLHLGHARTFWAAQERARAGGGILVLRNEDLDSTRFKMEFVDAMLEDLRWFGFEWSEGPDCGGPWGPYQQSERYSFYRAALEKLRAGHFIYPCTCSRRDIQAAVTAPHVENDAEPLYPGTCRDRQFSETQAPARFAWRFRVPEGEVISFTDGHCGEQAFVAGKDFGDFIVWRGDDVPAYQLACVADDAAMGWTPPQFYHCALMADDRGVRLAKRHDALSLRILRERGETPEALRQSWG